MTRREFVSQSIAAMMAAGMGDAALAALRGERKLRFGVVSDIHISCGKLTPPEIEGATKRLMKAFRWFDDQGVDAVLIPGDLSDTGRLAELQAIAATWTKAFPDGKGKDGRPVEQLFLYGNHDSWQTAKDAKKIFDDRKRSWEETFHEPFADIRIKTVKGFDFILASWWGYCPLPNPAEFEAAVKMCAAKNQIFFEAQHPHPKDTCHGKYVWGHEDGAVTEILSKYPNVVSFSGHSHYTIGDERTIWQGGFTSIGCGSLTYTSTACEDIPPTGYENTIAPEWHDVPYFHGTREMIDRGKIMTRNEGLKTWQGQQGLLVDVYEGALIVRRHEFVFDRDWPEVWEVPIPARGGSPFAPSSRKRALAPCAFKADAKVSIAAGERISRDGIAHDALLLTLPGGAMTTGCPLVGYEISYRQKDKTYHLQYVCAGDYNLPPQEKKREMSSVAVRRDRVPADAVIEVRPLDCFGRLGKAISAPALKSR